MTKSLEHTVDLVTENIFQTAFNSKRLVREQLYNRELSRIYNLQYPGFYWDYYNTGKKTVNVNILSLLKICQKCEIHVITDISFCLQIRERNLRLLTPK